eukprot:13297418-Alexandrium_andersonii.AAC.1
MKSRTRKWSPESAQGAWHGHIADHEHANQARGVHLLAGEAPQVQQRQDPAAEDGLHRAHDERGSVDEAHGGGGL